MKQVKILKADIKNSEEIIKKYKLQKHPEGGWYREIIRSENLIQFNGKKRNAVTSIYFLLTKNEISRWHKVDADEIWIFLDGDSLELHKADLKKKRYSVEELNPENRQVLVNTGVWQAARSKGNFSFAACVVAPGFEFEGFKLLDNNAPESEKILKLNKKVKDFI
ncbi:MAG: cupin domain-containing protein [bacterium]